MARTWWPAASSCRMQWLPMKPEPPVTSTMLTCAPRTPPSGRSATRRVSAPAASIGCSRAKGFIDSNASSTWLASFLMLMPTTRNPEKADFVIADAVEAAARRQAVEQRQAGAVQPGLHRRHQHRGVGRAAEQLGERLGDGALRSRESIAASCSQVGEESELQPAGSASRVPPGTPPRTPLPNASGVRRVTGSRSRAKKFEQRDRLEGTGGTYEETAPRVPSQGFGVPTSRVWEFPIARGWEFPINDF